MEWILNGIIIILLSCTIVFCWRLNNKIVELRDNKKDLLSLIGTFDNAIVTAHNSIKTLKETSYNASEDLRRYVDKSHELISDLSFMTDAANKAADDLEKAVLLSQSKRNIKASSTKVGKKTIKKTTVKNS